MKMMSAFAAASSIDDVTVEWPILEERSSARFVGAIENYEGLVEVAFLDEVLAYTLIDMIVHFI
jgi:hypothetical protein